MGYEDQYQQAQSSKYECLLFDLDDTLYPLSSGISAELTKNIRDYMVEKLGIEESKIPQICDLLYKNYGTTMAGLRAIGYNFDHDDYHSFVHGKLPYESLKPDPVLRNILLTLPARKVIFTNGDRIHATKVLSRLGLEECFEGIICFETLNPPNGFSTDETATATNVFDIIGHFSRLGAVDDLPKTPILCKPWENAMEHALKIANINPHKTIFFDDSTRNIQSGKRAGLHTVLIGTSTRVNGADYALESIHNIREALPELWEEAKKSEEIPYSGKIAIETSVIA